MTLFCPHCQATLAYPIAGETVQVCAVCGQHVPADADLVAQREREQAAELAAAELAQKLERDDNQFAQHVRESLPAGLVELIDEYQFYLGQQSIPHPTPEQIARLADRLFPDAGSAVREQLNAYGTRPFEDERERVQLAILKLSGGDREVLAAKLAAAQSDFRDVVVEAEIPNALAFGLFQVLALGGTHKLQIATRDLLQYLEWLAAVRNP